MLLTDNIESGGSCSVSCMLLVFIITPYNGLYTRRNESLAKAVVSKLPLKGSDVFSLVNFVQITPECDYIYKKLYYCRTRQLSLG